MSLTPLLLAAGHWVGSSVLHDPTTGKPETSGSVATLTPLLGDRFVRLDYTWAYQGQPQEGSLLIGFHSHAQLLTGHWIDSWHNGTAVMALSGPPCADGRCVLRGSYPAPPDPDWGWRIELDPAADSLCLRMFNHAPGDDAGEAAVEAAYRRDTTR